MITIDGKKQLEFLSNIVQTSDQAIIGISPDGTILSWNRAAELLYGYSSDEIIGQNISLIIPPYLKEIVFNKVLAEGKTERQYVCIWTKQGTPVNVDMVFNPVRDANGKTVGISLFSRDVSPEEKTANKLSCMFALFEAVNDAAIVAKNDGTIMYWNHGAVRLFGWEAEEILGRNIADFLEPNIIHDDPRDMSEFCPGTWKGHSQVLTKNKEKRYVRLAVSTAPKSIRDFDFLVIIISDITEIIEAQVEMEETVRANNELLANIAHEVRTPMSGILGYTELLASSRELNSSQKEYLEIMKQNAEHLLDLINDILDLSKMEANRMFLDRSFFDIGELIKFSCKIFKPIMAEKKLQLKIIIDKDIPQKLGGDSKRIKQVLNNLLSNAVKFTSTGKIKITVSKGELPGCSSKQFPLRIAVTDTGIGIPEEKMSTIFEPFIQINNLTAQKYGGGVGLSLAICRRLVETMGGSIEVKSKLNQGSSFIFTIPVTIGSLDETHFYYDCYTKNYKPFKLVLISNNKFTGQKLNNFFEKSNFTLITATNDAAAFEVIKNCSPAVVIFEPDTPDDDNYPIIDQIKHSPETAHIPVVMYTDPKNEASASIKKTAADRKLLQKITEAIENKSSSDICPPKNKILLISNNVISLRIMKQILEDEGYEAVAVEGIQQAENYLSSNFCNMLIVEMELLERKNRDFISRIRSQYSDKDLPIIALRSDNTQSLDGITSYLDKPIRKKAFTTFVKQYCPII